MAEPDWEAEARRITSSWVLHPADQRLLFADIAALARDAHARGDAEGYARGRREGVEEAAKTCDRHASGRARLLGEDDELVRGTRYLASRIRADIRESECRDPGPCGVGTYHCGCRHPRTLLEDDHE